MHKRTCQWIVFVAALINILVRSQAVSSLGGRIERD